MSETFTPDNLIGGSQKPIVNRAGTAAAGQTWIRGQLVGLLTATNRWQICDFNAVATYEDFGVSPEAVDTTTGEKNVTLYVEGEFASAHIAFSYGDTAADWLSALADHGIYLRASVSTAGV